MLRERKQGGEKWQFQNYLSVTKVAPIPPSLTLHCPFATLGWQIDERGLGKLAPDPLLHPHCPLAQVRLPSGPSPPSESHGRWGS